jgi:signal transduction histidine kinase
MTPARPAWRLVGSIALAVLCGLLTLSSAGQHGAGDSTFPPVLLSLSMLGAFPMIGVSVLLVWRHRRPVLVSAIATGLTLVIPTSPLPAMVALAAVTFARKGWLRWWLIIAAYAATVVSFSWDVATHESFTADLFGNPAEGTPARLALFWVVPLLAALAVAPFAAYGIGRRLLAERNSARQDTATANRTVTALQRQVEQQLQRQEIARELHDTLAADLSQVALHAGALELIVGNADPRAVSAARTVREATQHSLDDLRSMVKSLRDHDRPGSNEKGLGDLPELIDEASRSGADVRTLLMLSDTASCSPRVGHACYRIVQESISNVRRHAPGAALYLDVRGGPSFGLTIRATNWLVPGAMPTSRGSGLGLQGMHERALLVGGTFQAGATQEGGFAITAWLPWTTR